MTDTMRQNYGFYVYANVIGVHDDNPDDFPDNYIRKRIHGFEKKVSVNSEFLCEGSGICIIRIDLRFVQVLTSEWGTLFIIQIGWAVKFQDSRSNFVTYYL